MSEQTNTRENFRRETGPDDSGSFGAYGGQFRPSPLEGPFAEITQAYNEIQNDAAFLDDPVELIGVEPLGRGTAVGDHAASMTYGTPGVIHGFNCYLLQNAEGNPSPVYSCASGLDYPGVDPEHSYLKDTGRVRYVTASDDECRDAFFALSRKEGLIPALESAHAVAHPLVTAREMGTGTVLVNLSGRGDKDMDYVVENWGIGQN